MARDNTGRQCARCEHATRDKLITPPEVSAEFWQTEQFREAFTARHMGRISRIYRLHPDHGAVYGPAGISQTLLGQWLGLRQPQISRFENGPPLQLLDTLQHWARTLRIPPHLLWFRMPQDANHPATTEPGPIATETPGTTSTDPHHEPVDDPEHDPVLVAPWNHRGTVEAVVVLSGGDRVKRRTFLSLSGPALTAPAHQWLIHEPEPLISGLSGRRVSTPLVDRFAAMIAELRKMDDAAGGGSVLTLARQQFGWIAGLLDNASYDDTAGRSLHRGLAELGQLCGWSAYDAGDHSLAQRYWVAGLRAAHTANDPPLGAHILASMAEQAARHGQPSEASTLIETALAGTRGQATPALLAELHIRHAYALGASKDTVGCNTAISKAKTQVTRLNADDEPKWLYWVSDPAITIGAGDALLELGKAGRAAALFADGIAQFSESFVRDRQLFTTLRADALARPGAGQDLEAAAALGMQSLDLSETVSSRRGTEYLRNLYRQLKPHENASAIREFLERTEDLADVST